MESVVELVAKTAAPTRTSVEFFDARELPPPKPLQETLERLVQVPDSTVFVQLNDRAPQFLYPKLDDRGYTYETFSIPEGDVTVIWSMDAADANK